MSAVASIRFWRTQTECLVSATVVTNIVMRLPPEEVLHAIKAAAKPATPPHRRGAAIGGRDVRVRDALDLIACRAVSLLLESKKRVSTR